MARIKCTFHKIHLKYFRSGTSRWNGPFQTFPIPAKHEFTPHRETAIRTASIFSLRTIEAFPSCRPLPRNTRASDSNATTRAKDSREEGGVSRVALLMCSASATATQQHQHIPTTESHSRNAQVIRRIRTHIYSMWSTLFCRKTLSLARHADTRHEQSAYNANTAANTQHN